MLRVIDHGEIDEFELSTPLSRTAGIKVSAFRLRGTLIDTGFHRVRAELARVLESHPVERALVTHWHEDHSGNLDVLARRGVPAVVTARTRAHLAATQALPWYRWAIWGPPRLTVAGENPSLDLELVPTPGHSDDHVAVWDPQSEVVFGGDLFLGVKACTIHPNENPDETVASLRRILALRPKRYFDAHRGLVPDPVASLGAKAEWLATAIGEVERRLDRGDPEAVIRTAVLGPEDAARWVSAGEMSKLNFVRAVGRLRGR
jgi:glyoxylase-like metal-dependent hydrolase (beta-lactamase superfamily II)